MGLIYYKAAIDFFSNLQKSFVSIPFYYVFGTVRVF